jgi:hypothetical protein
LKLITAWAEDAPINKPAAMSASLENFMKNLPVMIAEYDIDRDIFHHSCCRLASDVRIFREPNALRNTLCGKTATAALPPAHDALARNSAIPDGWFQRTTLQHDGHIDMR